MENTDNNKYYKEARRIIQENFPKIIEKPQDIHLLRNEQFHSLMSKFPGIIFIIDGLSRDHLYISDNIKALLGYEVDDFRLKDHNQMVSLIPTFQHGIIFETIFPTVTSYIYKYMDGNGNKDLKVSYCSLLYHKDGSARWFHQNLTVIDVDAIGKPTLFMKVFTDIHDLKKDDSISLSISKKDERGLYHTVFSQTYLSKDKVKVLSKREVEVLNLMGQGKSSKEISELLCISEHTVYNHRKHMLKKMEVKRTGELLKKAMANGIL